MIQKIVRPTAARHPGRWLLVLTGLSLCSCGREAPRPDDAGNGRAQNRVAARQAPNEDPAFGGDSLPGVQPPARGPRETDERESPSDKVKSPMIRSFSEMIGSSQVIENGDQFQQSLVEADAIFSNIKEDNMRAIREVNRQVRVRGPGSPNVVLILADDLGYGDLGCYGQKKILTPNIDLIASQGTRFTNFYAGSPDGPASRWCLMTGRHTGRTNPDEAATSLSSETYTLANMLWDSGYTTGFIGKWGIEGAGTADSPMDHGFEEWLGILGGSNVNDQFPEFVWANRSKIRLRANADGKQGQFAHDFYVKEAFNFMRRHARRRPFFLCVAYTLPHAELEIPDTAPYSKLDWPEPQKAYAAMVSRLDYNTGQIVNLLKDLRLDRNTVVFVTSDNGPHRGDGADPAFFQSAGSLRGEKGQLYEGGLRVPMIVRWPGRCPAGTQNDEAWSLCDLLPTIGAIVGSRRLPSPMDGRSMSVAILGKPVEPAEFLYWETRTGGLSQAARIEDWKAVRHAGTGSVELFNLKTDPGETNDVAAGHPEVVARFQKIFNSRGRLSKQDLAEIGG